MGKHKLAVVIMNATLSGNYNIKPAKEGCEPTEFDLLNKLQRRKFHGVKLPKLENDMW